MIHALIAAQIDRVRREVFGLPVWLTARPRLALRASIWRRTNSSSDENPAFRLSSRHLPAESEVRDVLIEKPRGTAYFLGHHGFAACRLESRRLAIGLEQTSSLKPHGRAESQEAGSLLRRRSIGSGRWCLPAVRSQHMSGHTGGSFDLDHPRQRHLSCPTTNCRRADL